MLEKKVVAPTDIYGQGFLFCGSSGLKTGEWVTPSGVFAADGGPSGKAGKPGYAKAGDVLLNAVNGLAGLTVTGAFQISYNAPMWMVDKVHFQREDSDLTLDTLVSGQSVHCVMKGQVETDQYASNFFAATVSIGQPLYVNTAGVLTTGLLNGPAFEASNFKPRAIYLGTRSTNAATFDSNYTTTGMIWIQILGVN